MAKQGPTEEAGLVGVQHILLIDMFKKGHFRDPTVCGKHVCVWESNNQKKKVSLIFEGRLARPPVAGLIRFD